MCLLHVRSNPDGSGVGWCSVHNSPLDVDGRCQQAEQIEMRNELAALRKLVEHLAFGGQITCDERGRLIPYGERPALKSL